MLNIWTIFKREFKSYFDSAIGYIFLIVFWLISISLYMWPFFIVPKADMKGYFEFLTIVLCIFLPAVTMRLWAEERRLNTFEMLQTFPMTSTQVVLGKFFAALLFYVIGLAGTLVIPIMLAILGDPDGGVIVSSYFGALLLGALFLSLGIFISGFFKDQIVAYVVSLMALLLLWFLGTPVVTTIMPWGLDVYLRRLLGVLDHYREFTKGVIATIHVLYFLIWTVVFLFLNGFALESRSRKNGRLMFAGALGLCLGIGLLFNGVIATMSIGRIDMTENDIYTLSPATVSILEKLKVPVKVTVYISPKKEMPQEIKDLERRISDKLDEMRVRSGNKLDLKVVHLSTKKWLEARQKEYKNLIEKMRQEGKEDEAVKKEEEQAKEKEIEEELNEKGIIPSTVQASREGGEYASKQIYSTIEIKYKEKDPEYIPAVFPQMLSNLEYEVVSRVFRMAREKKPKIAVVAPMQQVEPWQAQMLMQMGRPVPPPRDDFTQIKELLEQEEFEVQRVQLGKDSKLPEEYDVLLVAALDTLNERQQWEINRAVVEGKPVLIAAQEYYFNYALSKNGEVLIKHQALSPDVNGFLEKYGITVSKDILMSKNGQSYDTFLPVDGLQNRRGLARIDTPVEFNIPNEFMNGDHAITNRLESLSYIGGSPLSLDNEKIKENKLAVTELINSGPESWTDTVASLTADSVLTNKKAPLDLDAFPCVVLAQGQFPDAFQGKVRPDWPTPPQRPGMPPPPAGEPEGPQRPLKPQPGKIVVAGSVLLLHDAILGNPRAGTPRKLIVNMVDYLSGAEDLISVRTKEEMERAIAKGDLTTVKMTSWKIFNIVGCSFLLTVFGIVYYLMRKQARRRYTASLR